jgi:hypothetical protein
MKPRKTNFLWAFMLITALVMSGCVLHPKKSPITIKPDCSQIEGDCKKLLKKYSDALAQYARENENLKKEIALKDNRLRRFNQLDKDGDLRGPIQKIENLEGWDSSVDGSESWQK